MIAKMVPNTRRRYAEIMHDVEDLINDHSTLLTTILKICLTTLLVAHQKNGTQLLSKLKFLVPAVGTFFTPLLLEEAFLFQDSRRMISSRCFVPPSFNDIRL